VNLLAGFIHKSDAVAVGRERQICDKPPSILFQSIAQSRCRRFLRLTRNHIPNFGFNRVVRNWIDVSWHNGPPALRIEPDVARRSHHPNRHTLAIPVLRRAQIDARRNALRDGENAIGMPVNRQQIGDFE